MSIQDPNTGPGQHAGTGSPDLQTQAGNDLSQATDQARHDLDAIRKRAAEDARQLGEQAGAKVGEATDKAKSFASDQKDFAAGQISGVATALNKVADELDGSDQQTVARYARDVASGLSRMGRTVQSRDVDDLMGMAQDFGRQQPVAFLGAAALAGFVASRFALASAHRRESKPASGSAYAGNQSGSYAAGTAGQSSSYGSGTTGQSSSYGSGTSSSYRPDGTGQNRTGGL